MILDVSKYTIIKAAPTALDTLKHSMAQLQVKVDSLQKITERAEIGKEFFSDTISTNLYMFATIIGLAALISWSTIVLIMRNHRIKVEKRTLELVNSNVERFNKNFDDIEAKSRQTVYDVNRAMYFACEATSESINKFDWALATVEALFIVDPDDKKAIDNWLNLVYEALEQITPGNETISKHIDFYIKSIDIIVFEEDDHQDLKDLHKKVKKLMLHIAHTIPQPPEDLMQGKGIKLDAVASSA